MKLDRLSQVYIIALCPILILPKEWLELGIIFAIACFLIGIIARKVSWILLAILLLSSYLQIIVTANKAENRPAHRIQETLLIEKILKQQDYQTAIAKRENGERLYVTWQAKTALLLDHTYRADFNFRPISSRLNEGNFDRQRWYFAQKVQGLAMVKYAELIQHSSSLRATWLTHIQQQTESLASQGLLLALAFGERAWLKETDWQLFQQTSTAHLIAISGLHIGLAFGLGFWIAKLGIGVFAWGQHHYAFSRMRAVVCSPFFAKFIGLCVAVIYSFLAGFSLPTLRALLAICVLLVCQLARRHYTAWQLWWRVVALILIVDPLALLSDSFWLSIGAVASLIFWYKHFPLSQWKIFAFCKKLPKGYRLLIALLHLQIGIWLVFSPIQLFFFEGISLLGLVANLIIVPLYSLLLVPLILLSLATNNLFNTWQLADWLSQFSLWLLKPLGDYWQVLSLSEQWHLVSFNAALLLIIWLCQQGLQKKLWFVPLVTLMLNRTPYLIGVLQTQPIMQWLHFDVGQGLATAFVYQEKGQKKAIFYDTGASWNQGDNSMASLEILPYLKRQGIDIEAIFISHDDNDHAGGVKALLEAYPNAYLISPSEQSYQKSRLDPCLAGKHWQFGELHLHAIFPIRQVKRAKNADSCVLIATIGETKILLTGDSGIAQEQQFSQYLGKIDLLQVGHHGSNTSTSHSLLAHTRPDVAIISAGRWNPWRLPNQQVEKRLKAYQVKTLNTAKVGMVKVDFYQEYYRISTARNRWSAWYQKWYE